MKKENRYIVNKIIVANCIFEVCLKATDNDVSYNNKTSYCMAQNSFIALLQVPCACPERCFAGERQSQSCHCSQLKILKVIFHPQFLKAMTSLGSGISE